MRTGKKKWKINRLTNGLELRDVVVVVVSQSSARNSLRCSKFGRQVVWGWKRSHQTLMGAMNQVDTVRAVTNSLSFFSFSLSSRIPSIWIDESNVRVGGRLPSGFLSVLVCFFLVSFRLILIIEIVVYVFQWWHIIQRTVYGCHFSWNIQNFSNCFFYLVTNTLFYFTTFI